LLYGLRFGRRSRRARRIFYFFACMLRSVPRYYYYVNNAAVRFRYRDTSGHPEARFACTNTGFIGFLYYVYYSSVVGVYILLYIIIRYLLALFFAIIVATISCRHGQGGEIRNNFQKERSVNMCTNYSITDNNNSNIYIYIIRD
jgi:hypothetical protein